MAEPGAGHLSIGEVLGLLLEEFPDVTISKIRFLESQGLIEPERTPSGYRKFFDDDVELLRVILREQRENFLPLRVIKDRIDSGEIETPATRRRRAAAEPTADAGADASRRPRPARRRGRRRRAAAGADAPPAARPAPPAAAADAGAEPRRRRRRPRAGAPSSPADARRAAAGRARQPRRAVRDGVGHAATSSPSSRSTASSPQRSGAGELYGDDAVEIAAAAGGFLRAGVDARHLRAWRTSVEREAGAVRAADPAAAAPAQPAGPEQGGRPAATSSTRSAPSCARR